VRRLSAEQFRDALTRLTGAGYSSPVADVTPNDSEQKKFAPPVGVKWIWNDPHAADKAKAGHVYFRKKVCLPEVPADATAIVLCDNSFILYLNGRKVGSGDNFKEASLFDLRPFLKPGDNLFAVDAVNNLPDNTPPPTAEPAPGTENPAGLLFYARLRSANPGGTARTATNDFASDGSWVCTSVKQEKWEAPGFAPDNWAVAAVLGDMGMVPWRVSREYLTAKLAGAYPGTVRAALVAADPLAVALARPNREQVVTTRPTTATTLQALELTNGETLDGLLKRGAENLLAAPSAPKADFILSLYVKALGRKPSRPELRFARELVGQPIQPAGVEDFLWAVTMLPEFQLIY
jgi:hypothetical protein